MKHLSISLTTAALLLSSHLAAEIRLPAIIGDNMVLQQGRPTPIWGWSDANDTVTVSFAGQTKSTEPDANGRWQVILDPLEANATPGDLLLSSKIKNQKSEIKNVLVGEVWLCSGQSNMQWGVGASRDAPQEIAQAKYPSIRLFTVACQTAAKPQQDCVGSWRVCSPESVPAFTAVGYFFGRKLHKELKGPIGLIGSSWGGTVAEAWTSAGTLREKLPEFAPGLDRLAGNDAEEQKAVKTYEQRNAEFQAQCKKMYALEDDHATAAKYADPKFDDSAWKTTKLPGNWEAGPLPAVDGIVWYRKSLELPKGWAGKEIILRPGPIDEVDVTWFNGVEVGARGRSRTREVGFWNIPREYRVPGKLVRGGANVVAIRVSDLVGQGGPWGQPADTMFAELADGSDATKVSLAGEWRIWPEFITPPRPHNPSTPNRPSVLYNAMIEPLVPFGVRGAIWYQGESNAGRPVQYRTLLPALIGDWRRAWQTDDFPFLVVQLANFMAAADLPQESKWAALREAQLKTLAVPKTGLAVAIDIGEAKDIHPRNKQDVGLRLALWALRDTYSKEMTCSGPLYESMKVEGNRVRLRFAHLGGGLVAEGGPLKRFAIAGEDRKFVWAEATIDGGTVVVSSPAVPKPVAVRYAWANNPEGCNLYNAAGLPASPFRTDDWPVQ